jgi:hypothetical protein
MKSHEEAVLKAAVCYEINKPQVIEEVTMDPPATGHTRGVSPSTSGDKNRRKIIQEGKA